MNVLKESKHGNIRGNMASGTENPDFYQFLVWRDFSIFCTVIHQFSILPTTKNVSKVAPSISAEGSVDWVQQPDQGAGHLDGNLFFFHLVYVYLTPFSY